MALGEGGSLESESRAQSSCVALDKSLNFSVLTVFLGKEATKKPTSQSTDSTKICKRHKGNQTDAVTSRRSLKRWHLNCDSIHMK